MQTAKISYVTKLNKEQNLKTLEANILSKYVKKYKKGSSLFRCTQDLPKFHQFSKSGRTGPYKGFLIKMSVGGSVIRSFLLIKVKKAIQI